MTAISLQPPFQVRLHKYYTHLCNLVNFICLLTLSKPRTSIFQCDQISRGLQCLQMFCARLSVRKWIRNLHKNACESLGKEACFVGAIWLITIHNHPFSHADATGVVLLVFFLLHSGQLPHHNQHDGHQHRFDLRKNNKYFFHLYFFFFTKTLFTIGLWVPQWWTVTNSTRQYDWAHLESQVMATFFLY
jgi:hypothetical protein